MTAWIGVASADHVARGRAGGFKWVYVVRFGVLRISDTDRDHILPAMQAD